MTREAPSEARGLISRVPAPPRQSVTEVKVKIKIKINSSDRPNDGVASPVAEALLSVG
jgi:hypothetical protein